RQLDLPPAGIRVNGRRSTPGRYFQAADSGSGWGGTNIENPLEIIRRVDPKIAWPGLRLLMVSTTGEQCAYFQLDEDLNPTPADMPQIVHESVVRIAENCEPSLCSILFMGGAGGSLRAGVTENPIGLTRSVRELLTRVTCGGVEAFIWPGGGITFMVDVADMPDNSFGYVPTPALVAPIEFTMRKDDYLQLGGHEDRIRPVESVLGPQVRRVKKSNIRPGGINPPGLVKHGEK
ncbi:MAG: 6-hydroxynicotinate reductase, partial [Rhodobacteraceae bacterium]|nr:6-hydroxynicotinate reductase [Paracoccaceae bacterium]